MSKQHISIFPAKGILNGSIHTIRLLCKNTKELFIANVNSIGNSAGTTLVIIIIHLNNSLYVSFPSRFNPSINT